MGTVISTFLITAPLAFMVGWLISKAMFRHVSLTRPNPRTVMMKAPKVVEKRVALPATEAEKTIDDLKQRLIDTAADQRHLKNDIGLLKESVAERDRKIQDLRQQISDTTIVPEDT